jgi:hypothetical protein
MPGMRTKNIILMILKYFLVCCIALCVSECDALTIKGYGNDKVLSIYILDAHDTVFSGSEEGAAKYISKTYMSMNKLIQVLIETKSRLYSICINVSDIREDCTIRITRVERSHHGAGIFFYSVEGFDETLSSLGVYLKKYRPRRADVK